MYCMSIVHDITVRVSVYLFDFASSFLHSRAVENVSETCEDMQNMYMYNVYSAIKHIPGFL